MKTSLETVAAQRDELTMKLRAMARELAEVRAEIARWRERYGNTTEPGFGEPIQTAVLEVAPIPAPTGIPAFPDGGFVGGPSGAAAVEYVMPTSPKSKRPRFLGGKP
jgi:hypothetical protein